MGIRIDWPRFPRGTSAFLPCVNTTKAIEQLETIARERKWKLKIVPKIERGMWGVRFWRVS